MSKEKRTAQPKSEAAPTSKKQCIVHQDPMVSNVSLDILLHMTLALLFDYLQDESVSLVDMHRDWQDSLGSMIKEPVDVGLNKGNNQRPSSVTSSGSSHISSGFFSRECRHYDENEGLDAELRFMFNHA